MMMRRMLVLPLVIVASCGESSTSDAPGASIAAPLPSTVIEAGADPENPGTCFRRPTQPQPIVIG
jgi:hypothetical protein